MAPLNPTTGQVIQQAAQGLSRMLELQQQLVAQQQAREEAHQQEIFKLTQKNEVNALKHEKDLLEIQIKQADLEAKQRAASPEVRAQEEEVRKARLERTRQEARRAGAQADIISGGGNMSESAYRRAEEKAGFQLMDKEIADGVEFTYTNASGAPVSAKLSDFQDQISTLRGGGLTYANLTSQIKAGKKELIKAQNRDFRLRTAESTQAVKGAEASLNQLIIQRALVLEIARTRGQGMAQATTAQLQEGAVSEAEKQLMGRIGALREPLSVIATATNLPVEALQRNIVDLVPLLNGRLTREEFTANIALQQALTQIIQLQATPDDTEATLQQKARDLADAILR